MLDPEKAKELDCSPCTPSLQKLRNCDGKGSPAKILLNNQLYTRCPRAIYLEHFWARYVVNAYFEYRKHGSWPSAGGSNDQTLYTIELFDFLDEIVHKTELEQRKKAQAASKKKSK